MSLERGGGSGVALGPTETAEAIPRSEHTLETEPIGKSGRPGIFCCAEKGNHTPPLPSGGRPGFQRACRRRKGGLGERLTQTLLGRSRGGEVGSRETEWANGGVPPPSPKREAPGSQDARRTASYVAWTGLKKGSTNAMSQLRNKAPRFGGVDISKSG